MPPHPMPAGSGPGAPARGLDSHIAGQRLFRAFLAIMLVNDSDRARQSADGPEIAVEGQLCAASWDLTGWGDDCRFSPQSDELVVLTDSPRRLAESVTVRLDGPRASGLPGLRPLGRHPHDMWFRFWHPPTGGLLQLRSMELPAVRPYVTMARVPSVGRPRELAHHERSALQVLRRIHPAAQNLLAATLVRLSTGGRSLTAWHSLWGANAAWTLRGSDKIAAADLAAALSEPVGGLAGAEIAGYANDAVTVRCGPATLQLAGSAH